MCADEKTKKLPHIIGRKVHLSTELTIITKKIEEHMNSLFNQVYDFEQVQGRKVYINEREKTIRYIAPNGIVFTIETEPVEYYGEAKVHSKHAEPFGASHDHHTYSNGYVCLANSIRNWPLLQILVYCDSWAKGYDIYRKTGRFPNCPLESFVTNI